MRLDGLVSRALADALRRRGLVRTGDGSDLLVGYAIRVEQKFVTVNETGATDLLASHHSSPSYLIQATKTRTEVYRETSFRIHVADRKSGQGVWRADLRARFRGDIGRELSQSIFELVAEFPGSNAAVLTADVEVPAIHAE